MAKSRSRQTVSRKPRVDAERNRARNPAARVVVFRFNDWLREMPFKPSLAYVETMRKNFADIGRYAAANHVRVVNMSQADNVAEFEEWLNRQDVNTDPAVRRQTAQALYQVWREGIQGAIRNAPDTLFARGPGTRTKMPRSKSLCPPRWRNQTSSPWEPSTNRATRRILLPTARPW